MGRCGTRDRWTASFLDLAFYITPRIKTPPIEYVFSSRFPEYDCSRGNPFLRTYLDPSGYILCVVDHDNLTSSNLGNSYNELPSWFMSPFYRAGYNPTD